MAGSRPILRNGRCCSSTLGPMPFKLRGGDFEGGWPVVADLAVLWSFDGPVAGAVAFDHSRIGAVLAFAERVVEDLVDDAAVGGVASAVRGENPRSRRLRGGSPAGIA
jgi:hypothetical protein